MAPQLRTQLGSRGTLQNALLNQRTARLSTSSRKHCLDVRADNVLIINTKGGGHAFLGLHTANKLLKAGHRVTILNDGDKDKLSKKQPFSAYNALDGLNVVWGDPKDPVTYPEEEFDVVYDNNGKDLDTCRPAIDTFKGRVKHYVFVSSAGMYKPDPIEPMHVEGDALKESAGHYAVEQYLKEEQLPYTIFRPQYIYGPNTAKDCEQYYIDRIIRDRPVCIPAPGIQLTSISHVEDLATLLASVPGNERAVGEDFNLVGDRCYTLVGLAEMIAKAMGTEAKIVLYNPKEFDIPKGKGFPFRAVHFFASADKCKEVLGWEPKHSFAKDVNDRIQAYIDEGRGMKVDFTVDDMILERLGMAVVV